MGLSSLCFPLIHLHFDYFGPKTTVASITILKEDLMELVTLSFAESTAVCLIVKDAFETGQEAPKDCGFDDTLTGN